MEQLLAVSCEKAAEFPKNLIYHDAYEHNLRAYGERLDQRQSELFSAETKASLDLMEYDVRTRKCVSTFKTNVMELKDHIKRYALIPCPDLFWRFVFLTAPNSRERLHSSRELLSYILSYHQVMPSFLDFLFPFGRQEKPCDLNFSGFRQETRLQPVYSHLQIPALGRSGRELRLCYNLKSVEPSEYQPSIPWSIRQAAVYHSLDVETGKAFWIIAKADEVIRERIEDCVQPSGPLNQLDGLDFQDNEFTTSLATHMIICDWCGEYWRWYISYLEETLRQKTGHSLAVIVESPLTHDMEASRQKKPPNNLIRQVSEKQSWWSSSTLKSPPTSPQQVPREPPKATSFTPQSTTMPTNTPQLPHESPNKFSFTDFQEIQLTEDRAREVLLTLESNITVLTQLREYYNTVIQLEHFPKNLIRDCEMQIYRFEKRISSIIDDLNMQKSRTTTLLRLVADRKNLLYGLLQFQEMEASKVLARKAQELNENMEFMTKDMHIIALKTKSETVSMRIITLVTLFFLPGTFISTIMSTDIVQFQTDNNGKTQKVFYLDALQLFLAICLPMMVLVFVAWYGVYWWIDRKEAGRRHSNELDKV